MTQWSIRQPERHSGRPRNTATPAMWGHRGWPGADRGRALLFSCYLQERHAQAPARRNRPPCIFPVICREPSFFPVI